MSAVQHTPKYTVKIDGQPLAKDLAGALVEINVDQSVEMADMFTIVFRNDANKASDSPALQPGKRVEIELGYQENGGKTQAVFDGEISALRAIFPRKGTTKLRVHGYTKHHRLQRGRFTRAFNGMTYSAIAQKIAQEIGLQPAGDATTPAHEYVFQRNQTNLEFLTEMATRVGFEVFAADGKLFFRKPKTDGASARTLVRGQSLLDFRPRVKAALVPSAVGLLDWDPLKAAPVKGEAKKDDAGPAMGGQSPAITVVKPLGEAAQAVRYTRVLDKAEADNLARSVLKAATQNLVHAEASAAGMPDVRPGSVVSVDGVGTIFGGDYYVNRVIHNFLPHGFTTVLGLRKSSIVKQPAQPQQQPPPPAAAAPAPPSHAVTARLVDRDTQQPLSNRRYEVLDPSGAVFATGMTDWQGNLQHPVPAAGSYSVRPVAATAPAAASPAPTAPASAPASAPAPAGQAAGGGGNSGGGGGGGGGAVNHAPGTTASGATQGDPPAASAPAREDDHIPWAPPAGDRPPEAPAPWDPPAQSPAPSVDPPNSPAPAPVDHGRNNAASGGEMGGEMEVQA